MDVSQFMISVKDPIDKGPCSLILVAENPSPILPTAESWKVGSVSGPFEVRTWPDVPVTTAATLPPELTVSKLPSIIVILVSLTSPRISFKKLPVPMVVGPLITYGIFI